MPKSCGAHWVGETRLKLRCHLSRGACFDAQAQVAKALNTSRSNLQRVEQHVAAAEKFPFMRATPGGNRMSLLSRIDRTFLGRKRSVAGAWAMRLTTRNTEFLQQP